MTDKVLLIGLGDAGHQIIKDIEILHNDRFVYRTLTVSNNGHIGAHNQNLAWDTFSDINVLSFDLVYDNLNHDSMRLGQPDELQNFIWQLGQNIPDGCRIGLVAGLGGVLGSKSIVNFTNVLKDQWLTIGRQEPLDIAAFVIKPFKFEGGTDILAFNDPINGTFAVFENGNFLDVEDFHVNDYKSGRGFVVYENRNENLMFYANGKQKQLTNFGATKWEVKDDIVVWSENNFTYAYIDGQKHEIARYIPENYVLKNGVVAFRNLMGGVSALIDGRVVVITNQMNSEYEIYGNSILVSLFNNSFIVYSNGKKYTL